MHCRDAAVFLHAGFEIHQHRVAAAVTVENLFASKTNLHGTIKKKRGLRHHDFVMEGIALAAEAAAVGSRDDTNVRGRHLQDFGERAVQVMRSLRASPNGEFAVRIFGGYRSVLLDRQMRVALIEESVLEDLVGFRESLIHVAEFERDTFVDVAFVAVIVNARSRSCEGFFGVGDRCEDFVLHLNQIESFKRDQLFAGDYRGHWIADMADAVEAKRLFVLADRKNAIFDGEIFASEYEVDAGVRGGARNVDAANARVRVRRAKEFAMRHAGKGNVVGEAGLPGDFGASIHAAARATDYAEFAVVSVGFPTWRIFLRHRRSWFAARNFGWFILARDFEDSGFDGFKDLQVACAAAEISGERFANLVAGGMRILIEQGFRRDENRRSAIAALRRSKIGERFLQGSYRA